MTTESNTAVRRCTFAIVIAIGSIASACAAPQGRDTLSREERVFVDGYLRLLALYQSADSAALSASCNTIEVRRGQAAACALFTYLLDREVVPFLELSREVGSNPGSLWNTDVIFSDDDLDGTPDHPGTEFGFGAEYFQALRTAPINVRDRVLGVLVALAANSDGVYQAVALNQLASFVGENPRQVVESWDQYGSSLSELGFETIDNHLLRKKFVSDINSICSEPSSKCDSMILEFAQSVSNRK